MILDTGANIGTSALYFAQRYPRARLAVEPEDGNFALLETNTRHLPNVTALKAAVWGSTEKRVIKNRARARFAAFGDGPAPYLRSTSPSPHWSELKFRPGDLS
ncbi:FkbM family methyltransferase [Ectothiorhodospiraceae bacterium 2226]|nr:FkbM family methyltransferase [Ectothiorhodospiraceae bacterium 2226]